MKSNLLMFTLLNLLHRKMIY